MKTIIVDRNDVQLISKIQNKGSWECENNFINEHYSFDMWIFKGNVYKIYKDSIIV